MAKIFLVFILILVFTNCESEIEMHIYENYFLGLEEAKKTKKPILLHFTGHGSYGSRQLDEFHNIFIKEKRILRKLFNKFIVIQLLVDDPKILNNKDTQKLYQLPFAKIQIAQIMTYKNWGRVNAEIEKLMFDKQSQPLYSILTPNQEILVSAFGYTGRNTKLFLDKLDEGLSNFLHQSK